VYNGYLLLVKRLPTVGVAFTAIGILSYQQIKNYSRRHWQAKRIKSYWNWLFNYYTLLGNNS